MRKIVQMLLKRFIGGSPKSASDWVLFILELVIEKQVIQTIYRLVKTQWTEDVPGRDKKQWVTEQLKDMPDDVGESVNDMSSSLISRAIDEVHGQLWESGYEPDFSGSARSVA